MNLTLSKPLIFFDLETTGLSVVDDRIIQISMFKFLPFDKNNPNADPIIKTKYINPTPHGLDRMRANASELPHKITTSMVKDEPTFKQYSKAIFEFMKDSDLAGYNARAFDVPFLREEFMRVGIKNWPLPMTNIIDPFQIFRKLVPRNLGGALSFFCNKKMSDSAHDAEYDVLSTIEVLDGMIDFAPNIGATVDELYEFCKPDDHLLDWAGKLAFDSKGEVVFNFGKNKGMRIVDYPNYCKWMLLQPFPQDTHHMIHETFKLNKLKLL